MPQPGFKINDYTVTGISGKGVFASVVRAKKDGVEFAIKILRLTLDAMRLSGEREKQTVTLLNHVDPSESKSIIRLRTTFEFKGHLCLVYELMEMNLRETL